MIKVNERSITRERKVIEILCTTRKYWGEKAERKKERREGGKKTHP
jgi:hypothetical protein